MKIEKIHVTNFRMLRDLDVNLEDGLSLIIGRNNCGKTSFLTVLDRFLGSQSASNHFTYEDFNCNFQNDLFDLVRGKTSWGALGMKGIELVLYISYDENDDLEPIHGLLMDLDEQNHHVVLRFVYAIAEDRVPDLVHDFEEFHKRAADAGEASQAEFDAFMKNRHKAYFKVARYAVLYDVQTKAASGTEYRALGKGDLDLSRVICFRSIGARRNTVNREGDSSLSALSARYYEQLSSGTPNSAVQELDNQLLSTDQQLSQTYKTLFGAVINKIQKFGGVHRDETNVRIISTLSQQQLLRGNTTVVYDNQSHQLPESYNGLGYLNLISMIMEIELYLGDFLCRGNHAAKPAAVNLLFIEEPEAHTHPQLQAIFIKNIKELLSQRNPDDPDIHLQAIITTHSSHIVAESDFDDIKYFRRASESSVISKDLKELSIAYKKEGPDALSRFKFLKQYITLNRAEIFFADKVILFEGETECILLPAMLKKLDAENPQPDAIPLLSQNISRIACGAYSHIFDKLLAFLGIRTLIVTDLDSAGADRKSCAVKDGVITTNAALKHFYSIPMQQHMADGHSQLHFFTSRQKAEKILRHIGNEWVPDPNGNLMVVYQMSIGDDFHPRSYEDAFFHINRGFMNVHADDFKGLKKADMFTEMDPNDPGKYANDAWTLADQCVANKSSLALDILFHGTDEDGSIIWEIPPYIKEGLEWLGKN